MAAKGTYRRVESERERGLSPLVAIIPLQGQLYTGTGTAFLVANECGDTAGL
jgi:hypothetical protein